MIYHEGLINGLNFRFSILVTVQKFYRNVINFAVYFLEMNHYRQMNVVNDVEPLLISLP